MGSPFLQEVWVSLGDAYDFVKRTVRDDDAFSPDRLANGCSCVFIGERTDILKLEKTLSI